ncbi:propanediol utilization protein [Pseudotabrizicola alkalilacus]|uniref:propanediol utilization protein n=1 Tax=Pseudotabrizicola alkalilacus TaxID=2305252 RepID=UPI001F2CC9D8|nr:propanediol utilization protein [Pseudotabrizicola alkalilacus]
MTSAFADHRFGGILRQACHFGEWLQGRMGADGPVVLVTLRPDGVFLRARRRASSRLSVKTPHMPAGFPVPLQVLRRFLSDLNLPLTGAYHLHPAFPPGLGTGASTAALVAIARLAGYCGPPALLARACVAAEGASDPLMFNHPDRLIWSSREGKVLTQGPALPRAHLLGGFFGPPLQTRATDSAYDDISDLAAAWQRARNLADCAAIARDSATRCLSRRGPPDDPTAQLARDLGALGWSASHSGAARALIFAPGEVPRHAAARMREAGLRNVRPLFTGDGQQGVGKHA